MGERPFPAQPLRGSLLFFQKVSPPNPWPGLHDKRGTHSKVCEVVNAQWWFYKPISLDTGRPCLNNIAGPLIARIGTGSCLTCTWMCQHQPGTFNVWPFTRSLRIGQLFPRGSGRVEWEHFFPSSSWGFHCVNETDEDEAPHTHKIMTIYILNIWHSVPIWSFTLFTFF